jgi:hypothetical protein
VRYGTDPTVFSIDSARFDRKPHALCEENIVRTQISIAAIAKLLLGRISAHPTIEGAKRK